jgi:hypothetical protein
MSDHAFWLERPSALASETLLDLFDPGLEPSHVLLQLCEGALEDLTPAALVGEARLDPAQGLRDRVVLLLESLEAVVDRIEMPEYILSQLGDAEVYLVEPAAHLGEPLADLGEPTVHPGEPVADLGELAVQRFDELLVFGRGHSPCLSQRPAVCKCVQVWTGLAGNAECIQPTLAAC